MDLRVGRPVASPRFSPRPHRTGRFQPPRPPLFGTLCGVTPFGMTFGVPLAPYGRARLVVAGGRMSSGPPVRRLTEPFEKKPYSRGGRPSRTPPSAGRGTASPHDPVRTRLLAGGYKREPTRVQKNGLEIAYHRSLARKPAGRQHIGRMSGWAGVLE